MDILGLIVAVVVTAANTDDRHGLVALVQGYCASGGKRLRKIWVDAGYEGTNLAKADFVATEGHRKQNTHRINVSCLLMPAPIR